MDRPHRARLLPQIVGLLAFAVLSLIAPAAARAQQVTVFSDDFQASSGLDTTKWTVVSGNYSGSSAATGYRNGTYNGQPNGYSSSFPSYSLYFRSTSAARRAQMQTLDLSRKGAVLTFDLRYQSGTTSTGLPFDEFNTTGEEIIVEYSTNPTAGTPTWTQLQRFAWNSSTYSSWATATIYLPSAAWTTTTAIRFRQIGHSGSNFDHWAVDNVVVVVNPEPGTWALFGAGAIGLAAFGARRRRRARLTACALRAP